MNGLLLTMTEPALRDEEEFNAWYDTEHLPERLAIPGFVSARRWVAHDVAPGQGKYIATYELTHPEVIESPAYRARVAEGYTPWTKRILPRCSVVKRWECRQITPGNAAPAAEAVAMFVAIGDVRDGYAEEFNRWYDEEHLPMLASVPGVLRARRFKAKVGTPRYVALYDLADPLAPRRADWQAANATPWGRRMDELTSDVEWILRTYHAHVPQPG